ncbi:MAG: hypothetical protein N3A69_14645 [Leptospiraceae bacterium]|nr:hypothetical protein [Leptospiraceae bacterium]
MKKFLRKVEALKISSQKKIKDISKRIYFYIFLYETENLEEKSAFESFIVQIIKTQPENFKILKRTFRTQKNFLTSLKPSLLIEHIPTKERIAIECKFRKRLRKSKIFPDKVLKWATKEQIEEFKKFCEKFQIPLYIVIGLGGSPSDPKNSFCIPFEVAKQPEILPSILEIYKREPKDKIFAWKNGNLK